ncbi:GreA/GreB family elongation factor [Aliidiomarina shirensis]|uniref:GreA/GreB family elongation factor n=1 Tax=Aliidiomarina shirensis TaxID=1048642 RepID=UPI001300B436|nr:GreA/GreB family elongation factor [Aliidiomarina shirensis]
MQESSRELLLDDVQLASLLNRFKLASTHQATLEKRVRIGSYVTLISSDFTESLEIQMVEPSDSYPSRNRISYFSPLGAAIIGLQIGSEINVANAGRKGRWIINDIRQSSGDF